MYPPPKLADGDILPTARAANRFHVLRRFVGFVFYAIYSSAQFPRGVLLKRNQILLVNHHIYQNQRPRRFEQGL